MQITTDTQNEFKPVTMTLTFESQEEINVLQHLMKHNMSVPSMVCSGHAANTKQKLVEMMTSISNRLVKHMT